MSKRIKSVLNALLKIGIMALVLYFVDKKLSDNSSLYSFEQLIREFDIIERVLLISLILCLMLFNWLLECAKWQYLCLKIEAISFWRSIESVFCGLSLAIFTPNRLGEYGGRVMFLSPRKRIYGVVAMGVGAFAQVVVTNLFGALACAWFLVVHMGVKGYMALFVFLIALSIALVFLLLYFNVRIIEKWLVRLSFLRKIRKFLSLLGRYSKKELFIVFFYALVRYVVFSSQYFVLFSLLIPDIPRVEMLITIFLLFFIQSALPSLDLLDVGVRSLTASYIFSFITGEELIVMAIVASIWFVNLILPAIIGAGFVLKINFFASSDTN